MSKEGPETMKIKLILDIPPEGIEAWTREYGRDLSQAREDIKQYIRTLLQQCEGAEVAKWLIND